MSDEADEAVVASERIVIARPLDQPMKGWAREWTLGEEPLRCEAWARRDGERGHSFALQLYVAATARPV